MKKIKFEVVSCPPPSNRTAKSATAIEDLRVRAIKLKEGKGLRTPFTKEAGTVMRAVKRILSKQEKNRYYSFHVLKDDAGKVTHIMLYRQK